MRILIVTFLVLSIMISGCKKKDAQQEQAARMQSKANPVVTQINTIKSPLTPEAARSLNRVLTETTYGCGKSKFKVRFKPNEAEIDIGWGKTATLIQQITASGFLYQNQQYSLRGKGQQATLTVQGHKPMSCVAGK